PLTLSPWSPTQQGSTCTPPLDLRCALALPECPHVLHNGLHREEAPEIAILNHTFPVDQECPGGMIHHPRGAWLHRQPKRLPHRLDGLRVPGYKRPGGEVDA